MYDKEQVIKIIGEGNWSRFVLFMLGKKPEYDYAGLEVYYCGYVTEFLSNKINLLVETAEDGEENYDTD